MDPGTQDPTTFTKKNDDKTKSLKEEVIILKAQVSKLKAQNDFRVEALAKEH